MMVNENLRINQIEKSLGITDYHKTSALKQLEADKLAEQAYSLLRSRTDDVARIAKNTGLQEFIVKRAKNHLFYQEHKLYDGVKRFDPDYHISDAWHRLIEGNFSESDLILIKHEYLESRFM